MSQWTAIDCSESALADAWNLVPEPPACYTIESWAQMLQAYGPIYVDMTWDTSGNGGHARVLVGMESDGAADGFNIMPPYLPGGLNDFVALVIPELQRRGLFRTEYQGRMLRDHLGLARPVSRYVKGGVQAAGAASVAAE